MALEQRIEALRKRHNEIDSRLQTEESRPFPDDNLTWQLKRLKLRLKDEMSLLMNGRQEAA